MNLKNFFFIAYALCMPLLAYPMLPESDSSKSEERSRELERTLSLLREDITSSNPRKLRERLSTMEDHDREYAFSHDASKHDLMENKSLYDIASEQLMKAEERLHSFFTKERIIGSTYSTLTFALASYVGAKEIFTQNCSEEEKTWLEYLPSLIVCGISAYSSAKEARKVVTNRYAQKQIEKAQAVQLELHLKTPPSSPHSTLKRLADTPHAEYRNSLSVAQNTLNIQHNQETIHNLEAQIKELQTLLETSRETDKIQHKEKTKKRKPVIATIDPESSSYSSKADSKSNSSSEEETPPSDDLS